MKVKASGGIYTLDEAKEYIGLGADRIGASKVIESMAERSSTEK